MQKVLCRAQEACGEPGTFAVPPEFLQYHRSRQFGFETNMCIGIVDENVDLRQRLVAQPDIDERSSRSKRIFSPYRRKTII